MLCLNVAQAASNQEIYATMQALKLEIKQDRTVIEDDTERDSLVRHWAKALARLDDRGLGDAQLQSKDKQHLAALRRDIEELTHTYHQVVRSIFLNNFKLKRYDAVARSNRASLATLFFPSRYNHKTKRPISGILQYQQDISGSLFSSKLVNAGLLINFPELKQAAWIQNAQAMETELLAIFNLYRERVDGVKFVKPKTKAERQSKVVVSASHVPEGLHKWSPSKREKVVRKFIRKLQKVNKMKDIDAIKQALQPLHESFEYTVKPILVDNVNMRRKDIGARANKGDLIALFYDNHSKNRVGKHLQQRLQPYLDNKVLSKQDAWVGQALGMENSLFKLREEHMAYLKDENDVMW